MNGLALGGRLSLEVALLLLVATVCINAAGAATGRPRLQRAGRRIALLATGFVLIASAALEWAFIREDFSLRVVAGYSSREMPLVYRMAAFWGSQPGSLLLWLLVLSLIISMVAFVERRRSRELLPWAITVMAAVGAFFCALLVFVTSPFLTQPAAPDGAGLDPSLQNPYMLIHPPLLYIGYVGMTVPFAFAVAAMVGRRADPRWLAVTRRWVLFSWAALGIGMLLGAHWAYTEVGWGGYWAWDPVENAALMPWLAATAFLHSAIVQEKKGMFKIWNVALAMVAFELAVFGTFLTRSGVLQSVHSFVETSIGWYFLGLILAVAVVSIGLAFWRGSSLSAEHRLEAVVSRETAFLFNNLFLLALAFAVLWGVIFPLVSQAARGVNVNVRSPYFEFFAAVIGLPLLALMGIGPLIPWRRGTAGGLGRRMRLPLAAGLAAGAVAAWRGADSSPPGLVAFSLCGFVAAAIGAEFAAGATARRDATGCSWPAAVAGLVARNRRRYGGYIVHLAVVLLVVAVVASTAYTSVRTATLRPGQSTSVGGYRLRYYDLYTRSQQGGASLAARLDVWRGSTYLGQVMPGRRYFQVEDENLNAPSITTDWRSGSDLFVILTATDKRRITLKVLVNPLVSLLWMAGAVFAFGVAVAAWPMRRSADERVPAVAASRAAGGG
jgi:cytochrome c-type biogenesis protein CcmF